MYFRGNITDTDIQEQWLFRNIFTIRFKHKTVFPSVLASWIRIIFASNNTFVWYLVNRFVGVVAKWFCYGISLSGKGFFAGFLLNSRILLLNETLLTCREIPHHKEKENEAECIIKSSKYTSIPFSFGRYFDGLSKVDSAVCWIYVKL